MGLFDYTNPGAFTLNLGNDTNSFNFGGETHRKDSPFARWDNDYSSSAFTPYVPYTSANEEDTIDENPNSMAGLQAILSKFDEDGRYGIGAPEKKKAMYSGLGQLFKTVGQAGMANATGGIEDMGKVFNLLPTAYGQGYEKNIEERGQRKLAAELAKLDITDKYTEAEKDKIALQLAQDQYEERTISRKVMKEAFDQAMPPGKKDEILSHVPEHARSFAAIEWASAEALIELGMPEQAMERFNAVLGRLPEEYKLKLDQDSARVREMAKDTAGGQNDAQLEQLESLSKMPGFDKSMIRQRANGDYYIPTQRELDIEKRDDRYRDAATRNLEDQTAKRGADDNTRTANNIAQEQEKIKVAIGVANAGRKLGYKLNDQLDIVGPDNKPIMYLPGAGKQDAVRKSLEEARKAEQYLITHGYNVDGSAPLVYDPKRITSVGGVTGPESGLDQGQVREQQIMDWWASKTILHNMPPAVVANRLKATPMGAGLDEAMLLRIANDLISGNSP